MENNDNNGNNRKKKKEFLKNNKKNQNEILAGFIITCDNHKEKNAINDAYNILNEVQNDRNFVNFIFSTQRNFTPT